MESFAKTDKVIVKKSQMTQNWRPQSRLQTMTFAGTARPMTSMTAAGFTKNPLATAGVASIFDKLPPEPPKDSPEQKADQMEINIFKLLRDGMSAASCKDYVTALGRIREAIKLEQKVSQHRTMNGLADSINLDLRTCIWMHWAQIQALGGQPEMALSTYEKIVKTAEGATLAQIRFNMGNINHNLGKYNEALKNFRMAIDQASPSLPRFRQKIASHMAQSCIKLHRWQDAVDRIEEYLIKQYTLASSVGTDVERQNFYAMTTRFDPLYTVLIGYYALGIPEKMIDAYSRLIDSSILISDHPDSLEIDDHHNGISSKQIAMADAELCNMSNDDELDDLSRYNATLRHEHTNKLLISARLLAPAIAWEESQGYAKLSDILREKGHHGISLQVQMSMALTLLKRNEFEKATDIMLRIDREGLESALALGINVPLSILQKTRNLSLTAAATAVTNQESDLHLLGIDPSVLANQQSVVDRDAVASRGAPEVDMLKTDDDNGTKKQPYAAFVPRGVHTNIAFIYYLKGDYEASARHAQIALEIDPYDSFAHINLGCTYSKTNQWELSLREFLKAQEINMESVQATYNAGLVYFKQQEYKTAYSCFQKVASKLPSYGDAIYMSADCLARMSQIDEAIQMLSNLVTMFSAVKAYDPSIYIRLGELYSIAGDEGQAAHYFKEAHRLVPFSLAVINWLGSHYIKNELYEQARVCFEKASRVDTTTPKWSLAVAACLRKSKQYRDAIYEYKHILKRFPTNTTAMTHLISSLNNIGQHKEADEWAEKLTKLTNNKVPEVTEDRELDEFVKQERRNSVAAVGPGSRAGQDRFEASNNRVSSNTGDLFGDVDIAEELLTEN